MSLRKLPISLGRISDLGDFRKAVRPGREIARLYAAGSQGKKIQGWYLYEGFSDDPYADYWILSRTMMNELMRTGQLIELKSVTHVRTVYRFMPAAAN